MCRLLNQLFEASHTQREEICQFRGYKQPRAVKRVKRYSAPSPPPPTTRSRVSPQGLRIDCARKRAPSGCGGRANCSVGLPPDPFAVAPLTLVYVAVLCRCIATGKRTRRSGGGSQCLGGANGSQVLQTPFQGVRPGRPVEVN